MKSLKSNIADLHLAVHVSIESLSRQARDAVSRGELPNFCKSDFVLVARDDFISKEKLSLRYQVPQSVVKPINGYVCRMEDSCNSQLQEVYGTRLKFYHDSSSDIEVIMSQVVAFLNEVSVQHLMIVVDTKEGLSVRVR